jgi:23S rRNA (uridine2552-2'-O)-methyltransferase
LKKNKISKNWLRKRNKDPYFKKSQIQGYRSRSAFKLIEMNKKFNFLKKNSLLLDLGSTPGGWSQVARKEILHGKILAVDIKPMQEIKNVDFINGDFCKKEINDKIISYFSNKKVNIVLSDMAANTSGNKSLDSYRTGDLCIQAMNLGKKLLSNDGVFLSKVFMGSIFKEINSTAKMYFKNVIKYKPISSKKESKEIYIYCKGILKI